MEFNDSVSFEIENWYRKAISQSENTSTFHFYKISLAKFFMEKKEYSKAIIELSDIVKNGFLHHAETNRLISICLMKLNEENGKNSPENNAEETKKGKGNQNEEIKSEEIKSKEIKSEEIKSEEISSSKKTEERGVSEREISRYLTRLIRGKRGEAFALNEMGKILYGLKNYK